MLANATRVLTREQREQWAVDGYSYCQMFVRACDFGTPYASLFERCTPRQRRLLGDLGHAFRPGDFFHAPEDQEALMTGAS